MKWKYYNNSKFEFDNNIKSAWWGHIFFAYDLVRNEKPSKIVELGTHRGVSFFSFCQAVKDGDFDAELYAIDTWEGDKHTGFNDVEDVFSGVKKNVEDHFADLNINLVKKTFDRAVNKFDDKSINLLHIDGLHTYEAVKNDFESWLDKMTDDGIVLFHDIHEKKEDFGVYKLWHELKEKYSTVEFYQWHGLGVLFLSDEKFQNCISNEKEELKGYYTSKSDEFLRNKLHNMQGNVISIKEKLNEKNDEIAKIKKSKFWKIRNKYIDIKNFFYGKI